MANTPNKSEQRALSHAFMDSTDTVLKALTPLTETGVLSAADRDQLVWFASHLREKHLSYADAGRMIGYDGSNIGRILSGRYTGSWENILAAVRDFRTKVSAREEMKSDLFVETSIWDRINQVCELALYYQMPGIIMGLSQMGKTYALEHYKNRALSKTVIYVRIPAGGGIRATVVAIAEACGIATDHVSTPHLRRRIRDVMTFRALLIVDEIHQLANSSAHATKTCIEIIREIYDTCKCGMVICGTNAVDEELINGPLKGWLDQFAQRCITSTILPTELSWDDLCLVAKAYGLPPPEGEAAEEARKMRMNRLTKFLQLGSRRADKLSVPFSWEHFLQAIDAAIYDASRK